MKKTNNKSTREKGGSSRFWRRFIAIALGLSLILTMSPSITFAVDEPGEGTGNSGITASSELLAPNIALIWTTSSSASAPKYTLDDKGNRVGVELTPASNADTTVTMQFEFSLAPNQNAAPGEIEIRIPRYIFTNRDGAATGTAGVLDLMQNTPAGQTGFYYTLDTVTNEYVIKNFEPFNSSQKLVCQIPYVFLPTSVADGFYKEITATATVKSNTEEVTPVTATSNKISVKLNTSVKVSTLSKTVNDKYDEWQGAWGANPHPESNEYCYVVWTITLKHTRNASTQPYAVVLTDELGNILAPGSKYDKDGNGVIVGGLRTAVSGPYMTGDDAISMIPANFTTSSATDDLVRYILVKYKKEDLRLIEVDLNDKEDASAYNSITAVQWGRDNPDYANRLNPPEGAEPQFTLKAVGRYIYSDAAFDYPGGGGEGWNTYNMIKAASPPLVTDSTYRYGATVGAVNRLKNDFSVNLTAVSPYPYTYAVYAYSQGFYYTFDAAENKSDPDFIDKHAHKRNYKTELVDDLVFINDQLLVEDDYNFVSCYLSYNEYIYAKGANGRYARTKVTGQTNAALGALNNYGKVDVYYKSPDTDGKWEKDGTVQKVGTNVAYATTGNTGRTYTYTKVGETSSTYYTLNAEAISSSTTTSTGNQYPVTNVAPNPSGPSVPIQLPAGTYAVKFVHDDARYAVEMKAYMNLTLHPTDNVKESLAKNNTPTLLNISSMPVWDDTGTMRVHYDYKSMTSTTNAFAETKRHDAAEYNLSDDPVNGRLARHGTISMTLREFAASTYIIKTPSAVVDNKAASIKTSLQTINAYEVIHYPPGSISSAYEILDGQIATEQVEGTFYDLLPKGTTYAPGSLSVKTFTLTTNNIGGRPCDFTIETVPNWQGSGRTMMIVWARVVPDEFGITWNYHDNYDSVSDVSTIRSGFQLIYTLVNSYDNINDNTATGATNNIARNLVAYRAEDDTHLISGSIPPTASTSFSTNHVFFKTLGDRTRTTTGAPYDDTNRDTVYAAADITFTKPAATAFGISKKVKSESDIAYSMRTAVVPGGLYNYELRYTNGDEGEAHNLIFYDVLEDKGAWLGTFDHVDTTYAESRGIVPVIYYATKPRAALEPFRGVDDYNNDLLYLDTEYKVLNTAVWTEASEYNGSLEDITAIAVDLSKNTKNEPFIMKGVTSIYCHVYMRAPTDSDEVERIMTGNPPREPASVLEARNRVSYTTDFYLTDVHTFTNKQSEETAVILRDVEADIDKVSYPETGTAASPTAVNPGDPIVYTVSVTNKESFALDNVIVVDDIPAGLIIDTLNVKYYPGTSVAGARAVGPDDPTARVDMAVSGQKLTFTVKTLGPFERMNFIIPVTVPLTAVEGVPYINQAEITGVNGADYEAKSPITYHAVFPSITISGVKNLDGRTLYSNEFEFVLTDVTEYNPGVPSNTVVGTVKNSPSITGLGGGFEFLPLKYTTADIGKTFKYTLEEVIPDEGDTPGPLYNVTYDPRVYSITIKVESVDSKIVVTPTVNVVGNPTLVDFDKIAFNNKYTPPEDLLDISGSKNYFGPDMEAGKFSFILRKAPDMTLVGEAVTNDADGGFEFPTIKFTEEDFTATSAPREEVIRYIVSEDNGGDPWINYAQNTYEIVVTLRQPVQPGPIISSAALIGGSSITFNNIYSPAGQLELTGKKTANAALTRDTFSFTVWKGDDLDALTDIVTTGYSDENEIFFDSPLEYNVDDAGKIFAYTVTEDDPEAESGWSLDTEPLTFYVKVTDENVKVPVSGKPSTLSKDGELTVIPYSDPLCEGEPISLFAYLTFNNIYRNPFVIQASKEILGNYAPDGMEFGFTLTQLNSATPTDIKSGGIVDSVSCFDEGYITFNSIKLPPGTYWFRIAETDDRPALTTYEDGTYDWDYDTAYRVVKVTISDNPWEQETIEFVASVSHGGGLFTNTFMKAPVEIAAKKKISSLVNAPATSFNFTLTQLVTVDPDVLTDDLSGSIKTGGIVRTKASAAASLTNPGDIKFSDLWLRAGTYWFKLAENPSSDDNWETDDTVYLIKVVVSGASSADSYVVNLDSVTYYAWDEDEGWGVVPAANVDFVNVYVPEIEPRISVEVAKDTIKRTSAAFDGRSHDVSLEGVPINNLDVEDEHYRYDINFRSTSNIPASEFIVDDPLESVRDGYVRVEGFWTPAVWGDEDGKMNVWYKSNKPPVAGKGPSADDRAKAALVTSVPKSQQVFETLEYDQTTRPDGWKLWAYIDKSGTTLFTSRGVLGSDNLDLPDDLAGDDYITAIRLEYGAVKVGFTSKNYGDEIGEGKDVPQNTSNDAADKQQPYRFTNGSGAYYGKSSGPGAIAPLVDPGAAAGGGLVAAVITAPFKGLGELVMKNTMIVFADSSDIPPPGSTNDWSPAPDRSDNPGTGSSLLALPTTKAASPLEPATYFVSATKAFSAADIVSSASAKIAQGGEYDQDLDAVLTRVITPFSANPEEPDIGQLIEMNSFLDKAYKAGFTLKNGVWFDSQGRRASITGDLFALNLWIFLCVAALVLLALLARTFITIPTGRRGRKLNIASIIKKSPFLILVLALVMSLPAPVFAGSEPPSGMTGGTLQTEYRYAAGEEPNIPQTISQFGFTYYLVSVSDPILESELPTIRNYTYRIEGMLTEDQVAEVESFGNIKLTPVDIEYERAVDKVYEDTVPTNDVDDIPLTMMFTVTSGSSATGFEKKALERVGVTFELSNATDSRGLPAGYNVTAVYRGIETYADVGYYFADITFTTSEEEGDPTEIYVVIAEYATDEMPPPVDEDIELILAPIEPMDSGTGLTDIDEGLVALQGGNPIMDLIDGLVPLGGPGVTGVWSFLSFIVSALAISLAAAFAIGAAIRRKRDAMLKDIGVHDEEKLSRLKWRGVILRILTIVFGLITLVSWLVLDDFSFGMVWINGNTIFIGVMCVVTVILCALTNIRKKDADQDFEKDMEAGLYTA